MMLIVKCNGNDLHYGLFNAINNNAKLKIDDRIENLDKPNVEGAGVIVIEKIDSVLSIIAVNYAFSCQCEIRLIDVPNIERDEISFIIKEWRDGDENKLHYLKSLFYHSVSEIGFEQYSFATFFTTGVPYSLILDNLLPISHVDFYANSDFFIYNSLYHELNQSLFSAIVFSPFATQDETEFVNLEFLLKNYYVQKLIGKSATAFNLELHIREFPFEILHISSHGGEIEGSAIKQKFFDRNGDEHEVEYDEVVSFSPDKSETLIGVFTKNFPRKLDNYFWKSKELTDGDYPSYVFEDMWKFILSNTEKDRSNRTTVYNSCSIKCSDFSFQANFNMISGLHTNPIIFNNTCHSWADVSDPFLLSGARGYIGSLWDISNGGAISLAEEFYKNVFSDTVLNSLHRSSAILRDTSDWHAYHYWGLHFTSLKMGNSINTTRYNIYLKLIVSIGRWNKKLRGTSNKKMQHQIEMVIRWCKNQLKMFAP
jgi:hypothetical protein